MKTFESNVQYIKYLVNRELSKRFFHNTLNHNIETYMDIAEDIIPGPKALFRCCIYKERHIIEERVKLALEPTSNKNIIRVLDSACDECPIDRFVVTEACRGCLAHKCQENCPVGAITIVNHRAYINQEKCIECGRCKQACPFNAISEVKRPCIRACPVGAVSMDENKKAEIDDSKCVSCGACVYQCPFGAIVDKSHVIDALTLIKDSWNNTSFKVYAVVAPSIASQFTELKIGQVFTAIKNLGFYDVYEAALGGDIVAVHEGKEFAETIDEAKWKTTSCCPAFLSYIQKAHPDIMDHVSTTVSPMVAMGRLIKKEDPTAKVVFIGPCTAKKMEIKQEDVKDAIDVVLTFEELRAVFDGKEMDMTSLEISPVGNASYYGRIFGRTGGVTEAVRHVKTSQQMDFPFAPIKCNGLDECIKTLKIASLGKLQGNFIEGMACKNGCTGGSASVSHEVKGIHQVDNYGKDAELESCVDSIANFDWESINLEREFDK